MSRAIAPTRWASVRSLTTQWVGMGIPSSTAAPGEPIAAAPRVDPPPVRTGVSTPAVLLAARAVLVLLALALGVAGLAVAAYHRTRADDVGGSGSALVVRAQDLYVALATADAAATTTFLEAGIESATLRDRYTAAVEVAGRTLADLATRSDLTAANRTAIATIAEQLPAYTGLVETARTNNRLGFAVGAAYLRAASDLMRTGILPAATDVYDDAARDLDAAYRAGSTRVGLAVVLGLGAVLVVVLAATQWFLVRRTRRWTNPALLAATAAVVVLGATAVVLVEVHRDTLADSRRAGADPLLVTSTARILALRSVSAESLDLVERGTVPEHLAELEAITADLGTDDVGTGTIAAVADTADALGRDGAAIRAAYRDFLAAHEEVRRHATSGADDAAVDAAVGPFAAASDRLDAALGAEVTDAGASLRTSAVSARDLAVALLVAVPVGAAAVAALTVAGLRPRLREYR